MDPTIDFFFQWLVSITIRWFNDWFWLITGPSIDSAESDVQRIHRRDLSYSQYIEKYPVFTIDWELSRIMETPRYQAQDWCLTISARRPAKSRGRTFAGTFATPKLNESNLRGNWRNILGLLILKNISTIIANDNLSLSWAPLEMTVEALPKHGINKPNDFWIRLRSSFNLKCIGFSDLNRLGRIQYYFLHDDWNCIMSDSIQ